MSRLSPTALRSRFESLLSEISEAEDQPTIDNIPLKESLPDTQSVAQASSIPSILPPKRDTQDKDVIILSMSWLSNRVGAAYYNIATSEVFVMEDTSEDGNYFITKALYKQSEPHYVLTNSRSPENFISAVKKLVLVETMNTEEGSSSSLDQGIRTVLKIMPRKDHSYENCYHRVLCLKLECEPKEASNVDRQTYLNTVLNFKARAMIDSLGILLLYLDKHWNNIALDPSGSPTFVAVKFIMLKDLVMMEDDSYQSLNITHMRENPNSFKFGHPSSKIQDISLFTFLNRCGSRPGVQYLWKTLQHPTNNIQTLNDRYETIEFFLKPQNYSMVENLTSYVRHIYRLTYQILSRYSGPQAKVADWRKLYKTVSHIIAIGEICSNFRNNVNLFKRLADCVTTDMHYIKYFIEYIIDFEGGKGEDIFIVKANVDPLLDQLRHVKTTLPPLLTEMGQKEMQENLPRSVQCCNMLYFPCIGFLLGIKEWDRTPPEVLDFPGFEFKFTVNEMRCYKSPYARELDTSIGDIVSKIINRQCQILLKLVKFINEHAGQIFTSIELCAELDTLLAFHVVARDNNYVRPNMVDSHVIAIKQGRHPIEELLTTFVPNDIYSGGGKSLMKIFTGPNACGKTIYLKQVAIIVFMAHIGSFVPAESATIGVVTHILMQMYSMDSMAINASSFLQDLRQVNIALRASTPNSLIIIDEFGKGTDEISGLCLFAAVLTDFIERGSDCPHVFAATHIHRVIKKISQSSLMEPQTMEYIANEDESITFLYRLISGNVTCSFAHSVAQSNGLAKEIVNRALEVFKCKKEGRLSEALPDVQRNDRAQAVIEYIQKAGPNFNLEQLKLLLMQPFHHEIDE